MIDAPEMDDRPETSSSSIKDHHVNCELMIDDRYSDHLSGCEDTRRIRICLPTSTKRSEASNAEANQRRRLLAANSSHARDT